MSPASLNLVKTKTKSSATPEQLTFDLSYRKDAQDQENQGQASGDSLHVPGSTGNPEVTEPGALDWKGYHWMSNGEQQSAPFFAGRNESQNPSAQASEDRSHPTLKKDNDMMDLLSPGVKINPNLVTRVEENLKNTSATWCIFARDCMWAFRWWMGESSFLEEPIRLRSLYWSRRTGCKHCF